MVCDRVLPVFPQCSTTPLLCFLAHTANPRAQGLPCVAESWGKRQLNAPESWEGRAGGSRVVQDAGVPLQRKHFSLKTYQAVLFWDLRNLATLVIVGRLLWTIHNSKKQIYSKYNQTGTMEKAEHILLLMWSRNECLIIYRMLSEIVLRGWLSK